MKKVKFVLLGLIASLYYPSSHAQIGYQIALLNTATGEARANETVTVSVSLSNSEGSVLYEERKSATTNDFGVLSLSIGNADTFKDFDLSKMPFYIEVTANGVMIGKSQILSVPVAEVAKQLAPIDKNKIVGTWTYSSSSTSSFYSVQVFNSDGTAEYQLVRSPDNTIDQRWIGTYLIEGTIIYSYLICASSSIPSQIGSERIFVFKYHNGNIFEIADSPKYTKQ